MTAALRERVHSAVAAVDAPEYPGISITALGLVEVGPRFVLTPIVIQESSFGGPIIYENKEFVSPNQVRRDLRQAKAGRYNRRTEAGAERKVRKGDLGLATEGGIRRPRDELDDRELFA